MLRKKNKNQPIGRRPSERSGGNAPAFSYYASRSSSDSNVGRLKKTVHRQIQWQLIPTFIAIVVIIGTLVYSSLLTTNPRLIIKGSESALLRDESVYVRAAEDLLNNSVLSRSKLMINTKQLERQLLEQFPELRTAGITVPLTGRRPILTLEAVTPRLSLHTKDGLFILDNRGRAVLETTDDTLAQKLGLPIVQDETGLEVKVGDIALSGKDASFIAELNHQLQARDIAVESYTLPPLANELHLRLKGPSYFVKFNLLGDARLQAGSFFTIRDKVKPAEYIDVRVEEKVFYK